MADESSTLRRFLSGHWRPGEGTLVENPFGIGWTINLANPRSWLLLAVAVAVGAALAWTPTDDDGFPDDDPVEIEI